MYACTAVCVWAQCCKACKWMQRYIARLQSSPHVCIWKYVDVYVYVCMCVCMCVQGVHVCMYVSMYVCMYGSL